MDHHQVDIGGYAPDFELPGVDGKVCQFSNLLSNHTLVVVVFLANRCSATRAYWKRLLAIQNDYSDRGVTLLGINSNDESQSPYDNVERMQDIARQLSLTFPYVRDSTQDVARSFGINATPEVRIVDSKWVLHYKGPIDDNRDPDIVTTSYVRQALDELLTNGTIASAAAVVPAEGSSIKWRM